jgi:hypothetical protein
LNNLGWVLEAEGDPAGALSTYEMALSIAEKFLGSEHPTTTIYRRNLDKLKGKE